ncbi:hypothetical protein Cni_G00670 [Canna indica]|uniref:Bromo domain-containing protein n=1 Tax=Canna indica TaxID=4628 RepID=A0AAQ3JN68_9LILI|nr:hypothetical protein Cni_G00670 [Canna indica]
MGKSGDPEEREIWGTWEELLLASAVSRHGTRRWDSVAMEIQSRSSAAHLVTPQGCRQRYLDLQRRFGDGAVEVRGGDDDGDGGGTSGADPDLPSDVPWLEQLRRLRVAELRSEVERYDLSIGSLQSKVKRLQEERERSSREVESGKGKPEQVEEKDGGSPGSTPESLDGDRISGGASGPSVEQSNSTDMKQKSGDGRDLQAGGAGDVAQPSAGGEEKAVEGSYNGSTGSAAAGGTARLQAMGESGESIAESKGREDGEGEKESSDVQSSASLSRRRRKTTVSSGGGRGGGGGEPETEDASIMSKEAVSESQPLVALLEIFRSDKYGSVFERRLESQESARYQSLVRQHVDLEIVRAKLDRVGSGRAYTTAEFFRDLLLVCTNAVVYYPKDSPEAIAAGHLRRLVVREMDGTQRTPNESARPPPLPPQPKLTALKPKPEPDLAGALADKPISSAPPIVCRKRSSISNKTAPATAKEENDEKPDLVRKESDSEEKGLQKKATKERSVLSGTTRGLRTNKVRGGNGKGVSVAKRLSIAPAPSLKSKPAENVESLEEAEKPEKKTSSGAAANSTGSVAKKQSATSFLNRMKRSSNGTLMDMLKSSSSSGGGSGGGGKGSEQKKVTRAEGRKDQSSRQGTGGGGSSGKKAADTSSGSAKRSVGRPPKRATAPVTPSSTKRRREEAEAAPPPKATGSTSRKRGRR